MAQSFTPPDPLRFGAKTLSIYITELQDCVNQKRAEIGQLNTTFINQRVDETMSLAAIEELKSKINQLALDFGFTGGVTNTQLLGRPYVTITVKLGKKVCHFPIINDLRLVLSLLVQQIQVVEAIQGWFSISGEFPLAHYDELTNPPWDKIPNFIQIGTGTVCPEGFPTCDNTVSGDFDFDIFGLTDKSLIVLDTRPGPDGIREGPLGGPYFEIGSDESDLIKNGNASAQQFAADELYFYSHGGSGGTGGEIYRARRDGSEPLELLGDFGHTFGSIRNIHVTEDDVIMTGTSPGSNNFIYSRMKKDDGVVQVDITLDFSTTPFDLLNVGGPFDVTRIRLGNSKERDGDIYVIYGEQFDDNGNPDTRFVVASAIMKVNSSGVMSFDSDLRSITRTLPFGSVVVNRWGHADTISAQSVSSIAALNSAGFYYRISSVGASIFTAGDGVFPTNQVIKTFNGTDVGTLDYKGDTLFGNFMSNVFFSENYLDGAPLTEAIPAVAFLTSNRFNAGATDSVNVTWPRTDGVFRYRLQRRALPAGSFIDLQIVESDTFGVGDIYTNIITGLVIGVNYEIRLKMETGQGEILGTLDTV